MTDLPPLPGPLYLDPDTYASRYTADQMRAYATEYGAACAAAYKADAERWRYINTQNNIWRRDDRSGDPFSMLCVVLPYGADLSCQATREAAIDAAIDRARGEA